MDGLTAAELVVFLGGQRSGKSEAAETLAATGPAPVVYVTTIQPGADPDLEQRVVQHRARRDPAWETIAATDDLDLPDRGGTVLVEGLGMWLAGLTAAPDPGAVAGRLRRTSGPTVVVTEEVGMGVIPPTAEGRQFADALGELNQAVVAAADRAYFVVAGKTVAL